MKSRIRRGPRSLNSTLHFQSLYRYPLLLQISIYYLGELDSGVVLRLPLRFLEHRNASPPPPPPRSHVPTPLANMSNREVPIRDWDDDDDDDGTEPSETEASTIRDDSSEHDAEDSSDEYVDARASHRLKKQYLQTKKTAPRASREPQGGRPVVLTYKSPPRRSTRPKRVRTTASTSTLRNATLSPSAFNTVKTEVCLPCAHLECIVMLMVACLGRRRVRSSCASSLSPFFRGSS